MFGILAAIAAFLGVSMFVMKCIVAIIVAVCVVFWDSWGKDVLGVIGAIIFICYGFVALGVYLGMSAYAFGVADFVVMALAAIAGFETLTEWLGKAVKWIALAFATVVEAVADALDDAFPGAKWILFGALGIWAYSSLSSTKKKPDTTVVTTSAYDSKSEDVTKQLAQPSAA